MMIKPILYYPDQLQIQKNRVPMLFDYVPIKSVVLVCQFFFMVMQLKSIVFGMNKEFSDLIPRIIVIVFFALTFISFLTDQKSIMQAHFWSTLITAAIPAAAIQLLVIGIADRVVFNSNKILIGENALPAALKALFVISMFLCLYAFYIWMCYKLVKSLDDDLVILPYNAQDLHQISRNADNITNGAKLTTSKF